MRIGFAVALLWSSAGIAMSDSSRAEGTFRVSVNGAGVEGNAGAFGGSISADGRFVAFQSNATNLVPGGTSGFYHIFVHDRRTRETALASASSAGVEGNSSSASHSISADGRFVAFSSDANNLVPGDTNQRPDTFVHDRATGETSRVSVDSTGLQGNTGSYGVAISADGRFVAFESYATNLVPGDTNGTLDVFVHERESGRTSRVSVDSAGVQASALSGGPAISADGRFVSFGSEATNLVAGDSNGLADVFVHDRLTGETSRVSVDAAGVQGNGSSSSRSMSADARFVSFQSDATNLVPVDTNLAPDVFVHDRETGETARVSVNSAGDQGNATSRASSISADGRYVAFGSTATNLVPFDDNGFEDVFVHDRRTGKTIRASVDSAGGQGNSASDFPLISANGRWVAFSSRASNLVPGDSNGLRDAFVRDLDDCREGNVNGGAGDIADVLFVNDSSGGPDRIVRLATFQSLTIFMAAPPSATEAAPFALYAWRVPPATGDRVFALPFSIGRTCLPTPLTGRTPAPRVVWNNTGSALLGVPTRPSSPAPSIVDQLPRGLGRPARGFVQGIIRDRGAPNGRAAVTNGVVIEIR